MRYPIRGESWEMIDNPKCWGHVVFTDDEDTVVESKHSTIDGARRFDTHQFIKFWRPAQ